jgi:aminoglycoside phosphotransferase family enzyme/predicted kinase
MAAIKPSRDSSPPAAIVAWLSSPSAYPHRPAEVERVETHISCVFLAGSEVYKLKKPVRFDFLDFSTLPAREHACREEVRLNRRLAPHVYLGVVPVTAQAGGAFALAGNGEIVDWLVHMRRLPEDRMLDALYERGALRPEHIDQLSQLLAAFYAGAEPVALSAAQYRGRCLAHVQGNLAELMAVSHHVPRSVVERVHGFQLQLLQLQAELFATRVQAGRIVEGHGDLRPEHICLTDPIAIFDCIEFNEEFRQLDVADELAFLAAECDFLGATWVGPLLLQRYQELSGDCPPQVLVDFYRAYRACVRAKVAALRAGQVAGDARERAVQDAATHLALADKYVAPHLRPLMLVVGGLSGTGKSSLARELAKSLGAELLRTDIIRQELFGRSAQPGEVDAGMYQPAARLRVYQEMLSQAAAWHCQRVSVVLDATFSKAADLLAADAVVTDPHAQFLAIECQCAPELVRQRILARQQAGGDASQATLAVFEQQRTRWEPWPDQIPACRVDTQQSLETQRDQVFGVLRRHLSDSR